MVTSKSLNVFKEQRETTIVLLSINSAARVAALLHSLKLFTALVSVISLGLGGVFCRIAVKYDQVVYGGVRVFF